MNDSIERIAAEKKPKKTGEQNCDAMPCDSALNGNALPMSCCAKLFVALASRVSANVVFLVFFLVFIFQRPIISNKWCYLSNEMKSNKLASDAHEWINSYKKDSSHGHSLPRYLPDFAQLSHSVA